RLVDRHAVRDLGRAQQFPGSDRQHALLDRRELFGGPVQIRRERGDQRIELAGNTLPEPVEERSVALGEAARVRELRADRRRWIACEQPLIQALQGEFARAAPAAFHFHRSSSIATSRLAISRAASVASRPFTWARSLACSSVSVVRMPLPIGMPNSSCTLDTPAADSLATISK